MTSDGKCIQYPVFVYVRCCKHFLFPISFETFAMLYLLNIILNFGHEANILGLSLNSQHIRPVTIRNSYFIEIIIIIRTECSLFGAH